MEVLRNKHSYQKSPHSHALDVVFQLNKCYLVNTSRSKCNQICKPQIHTVPGFRNCNRQMSRQTSVEMHLKSVCVILIHFELAHSQCSKSENLLQSSSPSEKQ